MFASITLFAAKIAIIIETAKNFDEKVTLLQKAKAKHVVAGSKAGCSRKQGGLLQEAKRVKVTYTDIGRHI